MKAPMLIAHRGLLEGPQKDKENHPGQINRALKLGFHCEVDLWFVGGKLYLGHDNPTYLIDSRYLQTRGLWIHAKNLEALHFLSGTHGLNYFWHESDSYTLTSQNYIWTYPGRPLTESSIAVMPEWHDPDFKSLNVLCAGVCSDFVLAIRRMLSE